MLKSRHYDENHRFLQSLILTKASSDTSYLDLNQFKKQTIYMRSAEHTILMATEKEKLVVLKANRIKKVAKELRELRDYVQETWPVDRQDKYTEYDVGQMIGSKGNRTHKSIKKDMPIVVAPFKRVENFVMRRVNKNKIKEDLMPSAESGNGLLKKTSKINKSAKA